jgi:uncharacterized protein (TIGR00251 family)
MGDISPLEVEPHPQGTLLRVKARAGGSRNAVLGVDAGGLRVSVTQIPEGGKANRAIAELLARYFACAKGRVQIVAGEKSSQKKFLLVDFSPEDVIARHLEQSND